MPEDCSDSRQLCQYVRWVKIQVAVQTARLILAIGLYWDRLKEHWDWLREHLM